MNNQHYFVQFLHPGQEHGLDDPLAGIKNWNRGDHKRKYMVHSGQYLSGLDQVVPNSGPLVFWGEWEPPSHVEIFPYAEDQLLPHFLHRPILQDPEELIASLVQNREDLNPVFLQNTDPYVFGGIFRYFVCRQFSRAAPTQLRNLLPGSVILFGSCVGREHFGIDTVFVVKDYVDLIPLCKDRHHFFDRVIADKMLVPDHYYDASIRTYRDCDIDVRLYRGATVADPVDGMFSFVPCVPFQMPYDPEEDPDIPRVRRPMIEIEGVIAGKQNQGYKLTGLDRIPGKFASNDSFSGLWHEVVRQVTHQGCSMATSIDLPTDQKTDEGHFPKLVNSASLESGRDPSSSGSIRCSPGIVARVINDREPWLGRTGDDIRMLAADVLEHFRNEVAHGPYSSQVVQPSMPVLFFGDYRAYTDADCRIVTVGVNPSFAEFRTDEGERPRFSMSEHDDIDVYLNTLGAYFEVNPYAKWFNNGYEKVLKLLEASYYASVEHPHNRAIHTDLLSPLATDPIWSKLPPGCGTHFASSGNDFWHRLIDILEPEIILASIARPQLDHGIRFPKKLVGSVVVKERAHGDSRKNPYELQKWRLTFSSGKEATLIWGRKQTMPFQDLGDEQKDEIRRLLFVQAFAPTIVLASE